MSTVIVAAAALAATMAVAAGGPAAHADTAPTADGAIATLPGSAAPFAVAGHAMGVVPPGNRLTVRDPALLWCLQLVGTGASGVLVIQE